MIVSIAAVCTLVFILAGAIVGGRLLWLARRTRGLPETTLGLGLLLIVGLGYPMTLAAPGMGDGSRLGSVLAALGVFAMGVGWAGVWLFTWRVFRPDSAAARWVSLSAVALLAALVAWRAVLAFAATRAAELDTTGPATLAFQLVAVSVYLWSGAESCHHWLMARRRLRLGLSDPVVANRFLLWFLVMLFSSVSLVGPILGTLAGVSPRQSPLILINSSLAGLACSACLLLAFLPPRAYLAWIMGSSAREGAAA